MPAMTFPRVCGLVSLLCSLWNLLGDLVFLDAAYATMDDETFGTIRTKGRAGYLFHGSSMGWLLVVAQAGAWMYPIWTFVTVVPLYVGLRPTGSAWHSLGLCAVLAYGLCIVGGGLHSAFAFLTALPYTVHHGHFSNQVDTDILTAAQLRILQHFLVGMLPGYIACNISAFWLAYVVQFRTTLFPSKWFHFFNPVTTMIWVSTAGALLPEVPRYYLIGCMGTWGVMILNMGITHCLWNDASYREVLDPFLLSDKITSADTTFECKQVNSTPTQ